MLRDGQTLCLLSVDQSLGVNPAIVLHYISLLILSIFMVEVSLLDHNWLLVYINLHLAKFSSFSTLWVDDLYLTMFTKIGKGRQVNVCVFKLLDCFPLQYSSFSVYFTACAQNHCIWTQVLHSQVWSFWWNCRRRFVGARRCINVSACTSSLWNLGCTSFMDVVKGRYIITFACNSR